MSSLCDIDDDEVSSHCLAALKFADDFAEFQARANSGGSTYGVLKRHAFAQQSLRVVTPSNTDVDVVVPQRRAHSLVPPVVSTADVGSSGDAGAAAEQKMIIAVLCDQSSQQQRRNRYHHHHHHHSYSDREIDSDDRRHRHGRDKNRLHKSDENLLVDDEDEDRSHHHHHHRQQRHHESTQQHRQQSQQSVVKMDTLQVCVTLLTASRFVLTPSIMSRIQPL